MPDFRLKMSQYFEKLKFTESKCIFLYLAIPLKYSVITAAITHRPATFKLRKYQLELAENAVLGRNTIICAETGSGKTWVALYIIQKHLQEAADGKKEVQVRSSVRLNYNIVNNI